MQRKSIFGGQYAAVQTVLPLQAASAGAGKPDCRNPDLLDGQVQSVDRTPRDARGVQPREVHANDDIPHQSRGDWRDWEFQNREHVSDAESER